METLLEGCAGLRHGRCGAWPARAVLADRSSHCRDRV